jgi:hypothetical protein
MRRALAASLASLALLACVPAGPVAGLAPAPACPRDAAPDAEGRCACAPGLELLLGACVGPAVGNAYCGPAARLSAGGECAYRTCGAGEALDTGGACIAIPDLVRAGPPCAKPAALVVTDAGQTACVPADVACPRGTFPDGARCVAPPGCPAGSLPVVRGCRPVVTAPQGSRGAQVVDVGAWAAVALGSSGGPGSPDLCRPLQAHPGAFGLTPGQSLVARLAVRLSVPDQDVSRVYADVQMAVASPTSAAGPDAGASAGGPGASAGVGPTAHDLARSAVSTLVEPLRGLGGQASAAVVELQVRCAISSL